MSSNVWRRRLIGAQSIRNTEGPDWIVLPTIDHVLVFISDSIYVLRKSDGYLCSVFRDRAPDQHSQWLVVADGLEVWVARGSWVWTLDTRLVSEALGVIAMPAEISNGQRAMRLVSRVAGEVVRVVLSGDPRGPRGVEIVYMSSDGLVLMERRNNWDGSIVASQDALALNVPVVVEHIYSSSECDLRPPWSAFPNVPECHPFRIVGFLSGALQLQPCQDLSNESRTLSHLGEPIASMACSRRSIIAVGYFGKFSAYVHWLDDVKETISGRVGGSCRPFCVAPIGDFDFLVCSSVGLSRVTLKSGSTNDKIDVQRIRFYAHVVSIGSFQTSDAISGKFVVGLTRSGEVFVSFVSENLLESTMRPNSNFGECWGTGIRTATLGMSF